VPQAQFESFGVLIARDNDGLARVPLSNDPSEYSGPIRPEVQPDEQRTLVGHKGHADEP
jgi:hypothetical protein